MVITVWVLESHPHNARTRSVLGLSRLLVDLRALDDVILHRCTCMCMCMCMHMCIGICTCIGPWTQ